MRTLEGTIERFTTAPRGEIDGAVLDDGTMIHWPPHLADQFSRIAARAERVRATGWTETGPAGDTHFEIKSLTNVRTNASFENDDLAPPPRRGLARRRGPIPPARPRPEPSSVDRDGDGSRDFATTSEPRENLERRVRALEDQIAQLREEIRELRAKR